LRIVAKVVIISLMSQNADNFLSR